jgi:UDP-N-acetyl-D-glucosamine dehydrogenase
MPVALIGLGYVGLPLSLQFARCGVRVLGLDIDPAKVDAINAGRSSIQPIDSTAIAEQVQAGRFAASTNFSHVRDVEAVILCVPTPLNKNREPDISCILQTGQAIAPYLAGNSKLETRNSKPGTPRPLPFALKSEIGNRKGGPSLWSWNPPPIPAPPTKTCAPSSNKAPA